MNHTTAITSVQLALVEANLSAVHWTIRGGIDVNENVCGLGDIVNSSLHIFHTEVSYSKGDVKKRRIATL